MRAKIGIISALICAACFGANYPQASQAWVNMRIEQAKSEIMAYIDAGLSTTNMTDGEVANTVAQMSVANMMPLVSLVSTPIEYTPNPTGSIYYLIGGVSESLTNYIQYGIWLPQKTAYTWGTNDILLTLGETTNTLTFSTYELTAPTNDVFFKDGSDWATVLEVRK